MTPVQKGAALLDERQPGWADSVDLDTLDLSDCWTCVLGQLFRSVQPYEKGCKALFDETGRPGDRAQAVAHGFCVESVLDSSYAELTEDWRREVLCRRS